MKLSNMHSLLAVLSFLPALIRSTATENSSRVCYDYTIPINATNLALKVGYKPFKSNYDVADFIGILAGRSSSSLNLIIGQEKRSAIYNISATVCSPRNRTKNQKTVLLATHGLGYDRRYWDSFFEPEKYNFVNYAIAKGYTVFFYDRLGTGKSSKVSGYDEAQALTQLTILRELTILLRSGKYTGDLHGPPSKLVHIGHSYGSLLSTALLATTPTLSDGAILTGIAYNTSLPATFLTAYQFRLAALQSPGRWLGRDLQYLTGVDAVANAQVFFHLGTYDERALSYAEHIKQPIAAVELFSVGSEVIFPQIASNFTGPVMILSGEFDLAFCASNCMDVLENGGLTRTGYFSKVKDFRTVVHAGVGHGINLSANATGAYKVMVEYLKGNGL